MYLLHSLPSSKETSKTYSVNITYNKSSGIYATRREMSSERQQDETTPARLLVQRNNVNLLKAT